MMRYRLDPIFDRTPDGAIKGIIRYEARTRCATRTSTSSCPLNWAAPQQLSISCAALLPERRD